MKEICIGYIQSLHPNSTRGKYHQAASNPTPATRRRSTPQVEAPTVTANTQLSASHCSTWWGPAREPQLSKPGAGSRGALPPATPQPEPTSTRPAPHSAQPSHRNKHTPPQQGARWQQSGHHYPLCPSPPEAPQGGRVRVVEGQELAPGASRGSRHLNLPLLLLLVALRQVRRPLPCNLLRACRVCVHCVRGGGGWTGRAGWCWVAVGGQGGGCSSRGGAIQRLIPFEVHAAGVHVARRQCVWLGVGGAWCVMRVYHVCMVPPLV